jgi:hypothetical protein
MYIAFEKLEKDCNIAFEKCKNSRNLGFEKCKNVFKKKN